MRVFRVLPYVMAVVLCVPAVMSAQGRPAGWLTRFDKGEHAGHGADSLAFQDMKPGFHVTTGPAAILWHPDSSARGDFTIESTLHLFDTKGRDREGYGVIVGGRDLNADAQSYTYFLLRNDGKFIVKQRKGAETPTVAPWTDHASINKWSTSAGSSVKNVLAVKATGPTVQFLVNGQVVHSAPRATVNPDGIFGIRANHSVNLHVQTIGRAP